YTPPAWRTGRLPGAQFPGAAVYPSPTDREEQTMTMHEYLVKAVQDDARRAGERDRLLREARRARRARRRRLVPAAPARRRTETEWVRPGPVVRRPVAGAEPGRVASEHD